MTRTSNIAIVAIVVTVSILSALAVTPLASAQKSRQFNGPPISGFLASTADFNSETPGVGQISLTSCTDGTDLGGSIVTSGNIRMNCDSVKLPHNEVSIAVDPSDPSHIVAGSNDYEIFFQPGFIIERIIAGYYTSFNGGTTWLNGHVPAGGFTFTGDPAVAFNKKLGLVHYGVIGTNGGQAGGFATPTVQVNTSNDGGMTFGHPVIVGLGTGGTRTIIFNDKPYITVDNNPTSSHYGRLYVTWTRFVLNQFAQFVESPIMLAFSDDGGKSFSTPKAISGNSSTLCANPFRSFNVGECNEDQFSSPAVGSDGTLYVAFQNEEFEGFTNTADPFRDQYLVVVSTDGGQTFSGPFQAVWPIADGFSDYPININGRQTLTNSEFRINSAGNLAVDPGSPAYPNTRLYVSFSDNRFGTAAATNNDVFIARSDTSGSSWGGPNDASPIPNDQFYPWAAVTSTGILKVMFMDRSYDPANVKYGITLVSSPNGIVFSSTAITPLTGLSNPNDSRFFTNAGATNGKATFIGDYNGLDVGGGVSHPIWTDMRTSQYPSPPLGRGHNTQDAVTAATSF